MPLPANVVEATEQLIETHNPEWKMGGGTGLYPAWLRDVSVAGFRDIETFSLSMETSMRIIDLSPENENAIHQAAALLVEGFKEHWPDAWPDIKSAVREVHECLQADRISRVAVDEDGSVLGWIGGVRSYKGNVWELHPLVVRPDRQRRGIGRALVNDLEDRVRQRGGFTIFLGTDDEGHMTSLAGIDLYPNVWEHIARIRNLRGHPYEFYQKLGFVIVGVVPDANGPGKPDILMAKQVRER